MVKKLLSLFIIWRVVLFVSAYISEKLVPFSPRFPYSDVLLIPSMLPQWVWSFANFDGVHYITIAMKGYSAQFTQVFFPLYPVLVGKMAMLVGDKYAIVSGLLITNIVFFLGIILFQKLLSLDYKKNETIWMIIFLLVFPVSFYFASVYSESLFFLFTIASFYAARKKKWWLAGIFGACASATRLIGVVLLPALLWEWYSTTISAKSHKTKIIMIVSKIVQSPILYLVPVGLIAYMVYLQTFFGDWLYFWHAQPVFGAQRSGSNVILLPQVIFRYLKILTSVEMTIQSFWIPLLELMSSLSAIVLLMIAIKKKVRTSYIIFSFPAVIIPTLTGTFSSMPRYILMAFPIYIVCGLIKNVLIKGILVTAMMILLGVLTILFTSGTWVS